MIGRLELGVDSSGGRTRFMKNCLLFGQAGHVHSHTHTLTYREIHSEITRMCVKRNENVNFMTNSTFCTLPPTPF